MKRTRQESLPKEQIVLCGCTTITLPRQMGRAGSCSNGSHHSHTMSRGFFDKTLADYEVFLAKQVSSVPENDDTQQFLKEKHDEISEHSDSRWDDELLKELLLKPDDGDFCIFCQFLLRSVWLVLLGERHPFFARCGDTSTECLLMHTPENVHLRNLSGRSLSLSPFTTSGHKEFDSTSPLWSNSNKGKSFGKFGNIPTGNVPLLRVIFPTSEDKGKGLSGECSSPPHQHQVSPYSGCTCSNHIKHHFIPELERGGGGGGGKKHNCKWKSLTQMNFHRSSFPQQLLVMSSNNDRYTCKSMTHLLYALSLWMYSFHQDPQEFCRSANLSPHYIGLRVEQAVGKKCFALHCKTPQCEGGVACVAHVQMCLRMQMILFKQLLLLHMRPAGASQRSLEKLKNYWVNCLFCIFRGGEEEHSLTNRSLWQDVLSPLFSSYY